MIDTSHTLAAPPLHHDNPPLASTETAGVEHGLMRVAATNVEVVASCVPEFIDLTDEAQSFVSGTGIRHGQLLVHSLHTTAAVVVNEREPLLFEDAAKFLERLAPRGEAYGHDNFDVRTVNMIEGESANAHAHLQHLTLGSTIHLPVVHGRVVLGRWQRILVLELDQPKPRQVVLQLTGISG